MSHKIDPDTGVVFESPLIAINLASSELADSVLKMVEDPFLCHINIRGNPDDKRFMQAAESVLGSALPTSPNTALIQAQHTVLWYGPREWLVLTAADTGRQLLDNLQTQLSGLFSLVTDISGGNTVIDISGSRARSLLKKATTIDVHQRVFKIGDCALTTFAQTGAALYQYSDTPGFRIVVRRSFADYVGTWLLDAAREYQR